MVEHDWELLPNPGKDTFDRQFTGPDGEEVHFHIEMDFVYVDMDNLRRCRRCSQEIWDGKEAVDCDLAIVRQVMES